MPRVALMPKSVRVPGVLSISLDGDGFVRKAAACLAERGRKRAAMILAAGQDPVALTPALVHRGLEVRPWRVQHVSLSCVSAGWRETPLPAASTTASIVRSVGLCGKRLCTAGCDAP